MENYDDLYNSICRGCLSIGKVENMISLIDATSADGLSNFGKAVTTFANIFLDSKDNLPKLICENCVLLLKQGIRFKLKCELTDRRLKRLWNMNNENLITNVCQYVIFGHYFPEEYNKFNSDENNYSLPQLKPEENHENDICYLEDNHSVCKEKTPTACDKILDLMDEINNKDLTVIQYENRIEVRPLKLNSKAGKLKTRRKLNTLRNYVCNVCHKVMATKVGYNTHCQKHYGWRFVCDKCGKGARSNAELQLHQAEKHAIGPYLECDHCSFKTSRKFLIIEHMRIHTGERPFTCNKCGLTFRREYIWKKHLIKHAEKRHQCPKCPKKFFMRYEMLDHMNNVHERLYVFKCYVCSTTYAQSKTVKEHLIRYHGISRKMQEKIIKVKKGDDFQLRRRKNYKEANCKD